MTSGPSTIESVSDTASEKGVMVVLVVELGGTGIIGGCGEGIQYCAVKWSDCLLNALCYCTIKSGAQPDTSSVAFCGP